MCVKCACVACATTTDSMADTVCYIDVAGRKKVHCGWVRGQSRSGCVVCTHCGCVGACTGGVRGWMHGWCAGGRAGASLSERAGCGCFCVRLSTSTNAAGTAPTVSGTHQPQQVRFFDRLFVCRCFSFTRRPFGTRMYSVHLLSRFVSGMRARVCTRVFTTTHFHLHHFTSKM